ncbi:autophagy-related protein-like protein 22 [Aaosphaeria arxii CBS 175.79]|uniref:Autophagy-related protein n=1 Tax=Aaosphaeria arxii CBS 175.79 TaxID=1450172 RepID=A0A6A5XPD1_9PLEO|nr:autophagy-related protein-like protein 22 [Aaosphaeria arxii CBS 175.79]KAF2014759.1 autophagy-related protein-like protein 22 [Aaosphaeria arxii CBS 175.79]
MSFEEEEGEDLRRRGGSRYSGEDTSLTTPRELNGWYSYAIAAEVFAVVGVGSFLPVTLEQLARGQGFFFSDRTKPCVAPYQSGSAENPSTIRIRADGQEDQCVVRFLGSEVTTASFAMYTFSAAVLMQAITLVCFSSFADHGPYRKKMLMAFAYIGSIASALFIFISPGVYFLAPILVIIGVTCLGCSFTLLNAFLPLLVSNHHETSRPMDESSTDVELEGLTSGSTTFHRSDPTKLSRDLALSAKLSSKGVGLGYVAAVCVQIVGILILFLFSKTTIAKANPSLPMRVILLMVGIWWAVFTIPTYKWLRARPGPPLPTQSSFQRSSKFRTFLFYTKFSFSSFWNTIKRALQLRQAVIFLIAWFLLSDAIATISGTAVLFARTELKMGTIAIALLSITSISFGIVGAFAWPRVASRYSLTSKQVLLGCVILMEIVPLYGLLGYVPFIRKLGFLGLQKAWEIYPLGIVHGLIMGGISSYARSVYAPLIPEGSEAAFFALYAVTDKGSSAVGPALVGWIVDRAGTIRPAFIFLAILVLLPGPLLYWLDIERGREDAARMAGKGKDQYEPVRFDSFEIDDDLEN